MVVKEYMLIWMSPDYTPLQWEEGRPVGQLGLYWLLVNRPLV